MITITEWFVWDKNLTYLAELRRVGVQKAFIDTVHFLTKEKRKCRRDCDLAFIKANNLKFPHPEKLLLPDSRQTFMCHLTTDIYSYKISNRILCVFWLHHASVFTFYSLTCSWSAAFWNEWMQGWMVANQVVTLLISEKDRCERDRCNLLYLWMFKSKS